MSCRCWMSTRPRRWRPWPSRGTARRRSATAFTAFVARRATPRLSVISSTIRGGGARALGALDPLFLPSRGHGPGFLGVVLVIGPMGGGLGIFPASPLAARLGWRRVLLLSGLGGGGAAAVQFVFPTPPVVLLTTPGGRPPFPPFLVGNAPFFAAHSPPPARIRPLGL